MMKMQHGLRTTATLVIFGLVLLWLGTSSADRPTYNAKYNQLDKEAKMHLDITLPEYGLIEVGGWTVLQCRDQDASLFKEKGEPGLFSFTHLISIPEGAKVKSITINPLIKRIKLSKPLRPIPEPVIIGAAPKPPIPDEKIYRSPRAYPKQDCDYSLAKQGSTTMLVLTLYPFKYKGKSNTLIVHEYTEVEIVLKSKKWSPNPKPHNAVDKHLKKRLVNPDDAFFFPKGAR
jgi:hypothetical protein